jgi:hypothetical protein
MTLLLRTLQQALSRGGKVSATAGLNSVSSGHTNFTPGLLTGDTLAQVETCTEIVQAWT